MTKRVLITGVNGFLGSVLWEYFKAKHPLFKVFGLDCCKSLSSRRISLCNLNNQKEVAKVILRLRPNYIFHLAGGRTNVEKDLVRNNVFATESLLEAVGGINDYCPRIIIPGSAAEYGKITPVAALVRETMPTQPLSFYGFAKNMQTNLGLLYIQAGLDIVIARIFNICGYGMSSSLSLGKFSKQIALIEKGNKKPVIHTGSLGSKRDFLDVEDVCSALLAIARRGKSGGIYNVCSGKAYLMRDLLGGLIGCSKVDNIVIKEDKKGMKGMDVSVGSNAKLKRVTGWKPQIDIGQSLKNTLRYYQQLVTQKKT